MTADPLRSKALSVLRDGRLVIRHAVSDSTGTVTEALGVVQSSRDGGPAYAVDVTDSAVTCTCRAGGNCAHGHAVMLVIGRRP